MPSGVRTASGLTPKQEMYCQLLARGQNLSTAYRERPTLSWQCKDHQ